MPAITFNKFDLGIDLRKGPAVSDANRLREMKNAHVTTGLATQKRPGLTKVATLEPGTAGLFAAFGKLHTFSSTPVAGPADAASAAWAASMPLGVPGGRLAPSTSSALLTHPATPIAATTAHPSRRRGSGPRKRPARSRAAPPTRPASALTAEWK